MSQNSISLKLCLDTQTAQTLEGQDNAAFDLRDKGAAGAGDLPVSENPGSNGACAEYELVIDARAIRDQGLSKNFSTFWNKYNHFFKDQIDADQKAQVRSLMYAKEDEEHVNPNYRTPEIGSSAPIFPPDGPRPLLPDLEKLREALITSLRKNRQQTVQFQDGLGNTVTIDLRYTGQNVEQTGTIRLYRNGASDAVVSLGDLDTSLDAYPLSVNGEVIGYLYLRADITAVAMGEPFDGAQLGEIRENQSAFFYDNFAIEETDQKTEKPSSGKPVPAFGETKITSGNFTVQIDQINFAKFPPELTITVTDSSGSASHIIKAKLRDTDSRCSLFRLSPFGIDVMVAPTGEVLVDQIGRITKSRGIKPLFEEDRRTRERQAKIPPPEQKPGEVYADSGFTPTVAPDPQDAFFDPSLTPGLDLAEPTPLDVGFPEADSASIFTPTFLPRPDDLPIDPVTTDEALTTTGHLDKSVPAEPVAPPPAQPAEPKPVTAVAPTLSPAPGVTVPAEPASPPVSPASPASSRIYRKPVNVDISIDLGGQKLPKVESSILVSVTIIDGAQVIILENVYLFRPKGGGGYILRQQASGARAQISGFSADMSVALIGEGRIAGVRVGGCDYNISNLNSISGSFTPVCTRKPTPGMRPIPTTEIPTSGETSRPATLAVAPAAAVPSSAPSLAPPAAEPTRPAAPASPPAPKVPSMVPATSSDGDYRVEVKAIESITDGEPRYEIQIVDGDHKVALTGVRVERGTIKRPQDERSPIFDEATFQGDATKVSRRFGGNLSGHGYGITVLWSDGSIVTYFPVFTMRGKSLLVSTRTRKREGSQSSGDRYFLERTNPLSPKPLPVAPQAGLSSSSPKSPPYRDLSKRQPVDVTVTLPDGQVLLEGAKSRTPCLITFKDGGVIVTAWAFLEKRGGGGDNYRPLYEGAEYNITDANGNPLFPEEVVAYKFGETHHGYGLTVRWNEGSGRESGTYLMTVNGRPGASTIVPEFGAKSVLPQNNTPYPIPRRRPPIPSDIIADNRANVTRALDLTEVGPVLAEALYRWGSLTVEQRAGILSQLNTVNRYQNPRLSYFANKIRAFLGSRGGFVGTREPRYYDLQSAIAEVYSLIQSGSSIREIRAYLGSHFSASIVSILLPHVRGAKSYADAAFQHSSYHDRFRTQADAFSTSLTEAHGKFNPLTLAFTQSERRRSALALDLHRQTGAMELTSPALAQAKAHEVYHAHVGRVATTMAYSGHAVMPGFVLGHAAVSALRGQGTFGENAVMGGFGAIGFSLVDKIMQTAVSVFTKAEKLNFKQLAVSAGLAAFVVNTGMAIHGMSEEQSSNMTFGDWAKFVGGQLASAIAVDGFAFLGISHFMGQGSSYLFSKLLAHRGWGSLAPYLVPFAGGMAGMEIASLSTHGLRRAGELMSEGYDNLTYPSENPKGSNENFQRLMQDGYKGPMVFVAG